LKVLILIDESSWLNQYLPTLAVQIKENHPGCDLAIAHKHELIKEDFDFNFILSYSRIIPPEYLEKCQKNLVIHESALPKGKGMSPLTWQILEGKKEVPITLFEAHEQMDAGDIYLQKTMSFSGHELVHELRVVQAQYTMALVLEFLHKYPFEATPQEGEESIYPRRTPVDSALDVDKSLREQFDLLRVCDNEKYPAFFELHGHKYTLKIEKCD
jgi:methionyl-tRNA formyltransferase